MASLAYLPPHVEAIHSKAVEFDVPTPVVDTLRDTLTELNTPKSSPFALRPVQMITALSQPVPGHRSRSKLFSSREHQDAQELFQLVSESVKEESLAVEKESQRDRGLGSFAQISKADTADVDVGTSVFDGLTANRRSCIECGYTEAVMHFSFDNWQLSLPRAGFGASCTLQDCLADYIRLELLTDCICRKCSMRATHARLLAEAERLSEAVAADEHVSQSKKKRSREAKKLAAKVGNALEEGRIEEDIKGVKMEKVFSKASTKQAMIARVSDRFYDVFLTLERPRSRLEFWFFTSIDRFILVPTRVVTPSAYSFPKSSTSRRTRHLDNCRQHLRHQSQHLRHPFHEQQPPLRPSMPLHVYYIASLLLFVIMAHTPMGITSAIEESLGAFLH